MLTGLSFSNAGLYFAKKEITQLIPKQRFFHMNMLIEKCLKLKKKVGVFYISQNSWTDLGQLSDLEKFRKKF